MDKVQGGRGRDGANRDAANRADGETGARGSEGLAGRRLEVWDPIGEHEVAQILGVIQQQVARYERDRAEGRRYDFPAPVKRLARGPLWDRSEIEQFDRIRRRQGGPEPGTTARRPRALASLSEDVLVAAMYGPEVGLSEREREVLRMRLGDGEAGDIPLGQAAVAGRLNITLPAVKKAQQRAVDKVLATLPSTQDRKEPND